MALPGQHLILQIIVMPRLLEQVQSEGRFEHCGCVVSLVVRLVGVRLEYLLFEQVTVHMVTVSRSLA